MININKLKSLIKDNIYTINFFPVVIYHLLFLPIWLLVTRFDYLWVMTFIDTICTTFIIPFLQVVFNGWYNIERKNYLFFKNTVLILSATSLSYVLHYLNWGFSSQDIMNPDTETLLVMKWSFGISLTIVVITSFIQQIELIKFKKNKSCY
ncbi:hypothetical protein FHS15_005770 [Paenibacillus castaneae]|nr:hypothetical protein [Paenibacillus castaneae]